MHSRYPVILLILVGVLFVGCSGDDHNTALSEAEQQPTQALQTSPATADILELCVSLTNQYRAQVNQPALVRSTQLETYAAEGAKEDAGNKTAHGHFRRTQGGGISFAENVIPWWPSQYFGGVKEVLEKGLAMMWEEGPGGGHYENIIGNYKTLGCGIYDDGKEITIVQDFGN